MQKKPYLFLHFFRKNHLKKKERNSILIPRCINPPMNGMGGFWRPIGAKCITMEIPL